MLSAAAALTLRRGRGCGVVGLLDVCHSAVHAIVLCDTRE
jgi:hypothetical protein